MNDTDIPERQGDDTPLLGEIIEPPLTEVIKDESTNLIRIIRHSGKTAPVLRLLAMSHAVDEGVHIYKIELFDPQFFSNPIVFEIVLDSEGGVIEPEEEE